MKVLSARFVILGIAAIGIAFAAARLYAGSREEAKPSKNQPVKTEDLSKLSDEELQKRLTPEQYRVCKQCGTEPPFRNAYWNNTKPVSTST
jgi:hypothetical protein